MCHLEAWALDIVNFDIVNIAPLASEESRVTPQCLKNNRLEYIREIVSIHAV
jgi:hypothetical protein